MWSLGNAGQLWCLLLARLSITLNNRRYSLVGLRATLDCLLCSSLRVTPNSLFCTLALPLGYAEWLLVDLVFAVRQATSCLLSLRPLATPYNQLSVLDMPSGCTKQSSSVCGLTLGLIPPFTCALSLDNFRSRQVTLSLLLGYANQHSLLTWSLWVAPNLTPTLPLGYAGWYSLSPAVKICQLTLSLS